MPPKALFPLPLLVALTAACSGGTGGNAGGGGTTTSSTTDDTTASTTTTPSETSPSCLAPSGGLDLGAETPDGKKYNCDESIPDMPFNLAIDGRVTAIVPPTGSAQGHIVVDGCASGPSCEIASYTFDMPSVAIPMGTLVHVSFSFDYWVDCTAGLRVTNLSSWNGEANPISEASFEWFAAASSRGNPPSFVGADYGIESEKVACDYSESDQTGVYDYRFFEAAHPANAVVVPVGQSGQLHVEQGGEPFVWTLHNLMAGCVLCPSDGVTFAHMVTQAPE